MKIRLFYLRMWNLAVHRQTKLASCCTFIRVLLEFEEGLLDLVDPSDLQYIPKVYLNFLV